MPIKKELRKLYPVDWRQISAAVRFERARGRCEACGRPHGRIVCQASDGAWWDADAATWRDGRARALVGLSFPLEAIRTTRVVTAAAHLDHDPRNNAWENLKSLCARCHLENDRPEHRRRRWLTYRMRKAIGDLFSGLYAGR